MEIEVRKCFDCVFKKEIQGMATAYYCKHEKFSEPKRMDGIKKNSQGFYIFDGTPLGDCPLKEGQVVKYIVKDV